MLKLPFIIFSFIFGMIMFPSITAASDFIVDSDMTWEEAMRNLDSRCPPEIKNQQRLIDVLYYSFDNNIHQGQIVIDERLAEDIEEVFRVALELKFPFAWVLPISSDQFIEDGRWSDDLSMAVNNTSAFNYREKTGGGTLSKHAYGFAIDINPQLNPYIKGDVVLPPGSVYNADQPGTLSEGHPVVQTFLNLGWTWGGHWETLKDYQHFEKIP